MLAGFHEKFIPVYLHSNQVRKPTGKPVARLFLKRCIVTPRMYQPGFAVYIELCRMNEQLLDRAIAYSTHCVRAASGDVLQLPLPVQTVAVIETAQGIIDNGGLEYFYESDFPGNPPYSIFVQAFRRIGAEAAARRIEASSHMFPFPEPHLHEAKRRQWIEFVKNNEAHEFVILSNQACGDPSVFVQLANYVEENASAFTTAA